MHGTHMTRELIMTRATEGVRETFKKGKEWALGSKNLQVYANVLLAARDGKQRQMESRNLRITSTSCWLKITHSFEMEKESAKVWV